MRHGWARVEREIETERDTERAIIYIHYVHRYNYLSNNLYVVVHRFKFQVSHHPVVIF